MLCRLTLAVVLLSTLQPLARAQSTLDPDTENARRHFERGLDDYNAGHYDEAIQEFQHARALRATPAFDYNIARCYDRLENWRDAADFYQRYLDAVPNAPERAELAARIATLRARSTPSAEPPPNPPATPPQLSPPPTTTPTTTTPTTPTTATTTPSLVTTAPPRKSWTRRNAAAIGLGGATLALAIVGSALVGSVAPDYNRLDSGPQSCRPCMPSQYAGLVARADAGYALWAVAGAAAVVDIGLFVAAARHK